MGGFLAALAADLALLALINVAVVHFTLSIVRYPWGRVGELPLLPLVTFCAMLDAGRVEPHRPSGHAAGSWEPLGTYSSSGGRAWVTALAATMLQAEARFPKER